MANWKRVLTVWEIGPSSCGVLDWRPRRFPGGEYGAPSLAIYEDERLLANLLPESTEMLHGGLQRYLPADWKQEPQPSVGSKLGIPSQAIPSSDGHKAKHRHCPTCTCQEAPE